MGNYSLRCYKCGSEYFSHRLHCTNESKHGESLLYPVYTNKQITIRDLQGIFKYSDWLPTGNDYLDVELGDPVVYKSEGLAKRLGLSNLYIAFSGYWPEKGANLITRTFKELECPAVIVNALQQGDGALIIPSAGNAANGYNLVTYDAGLPLYIVVPEIGLDKLVLPFQTNPYVIAVRGDYADAIEVATEIAKRTGLKMDGGVRNAARRAGAGTVMLNAVIHGSQELYHHYFQAVGSGTGAIAAWEAVQLLLEDGRFGSDKTRIHMAQNSPYCPIADSWEHGIRNLVHMPSPEARAKVAAITADVLTNRRPPYSIAGGNYDVLSASNGMTWKVSNYQVFHAARMFREAEGVDIGPPAAVGVDALRQAVMKGAVGRDERVLLHITGGGKEIQYSDGLVYQAEANITVNYREVDRVVGAIGEPKKMSNGSKLRRYTE